jgi:hypothetical protein
LLKDGQMLSSYTSKVTLERAGVERFLHTTAYEQPVLYAIAALLTAVLAGLAAAFTFGRATQ